MYAITIVRVLPTYDVTSLKVNGLAYPKLRVGSEVFLRAEVRDQSQVTTPLADPSAGVVITIRKPDGSTSVTDGIMINDAVGVYSYFNQTATSDPRGVYRVSFKISEEDGTTVYTVPVDAFELVP